MRTGPDHVGTNRTITSTAPHDRFQSLAARARGRGRNAVDGRGCQCASTTGSAVCGSSRSLRKPKQRERLVEFGKSSSTMARISGSDTASEAAVITVKQPRAASPENRYREPHAKMRSSRFDRQFV